MAGKFFLEQKYPASSGQSSRLPPSRISISYLCVGIRRLAILVFSDANALTLAQNDAVIENEPAEFHYYTIALVSDGPPSELKLKCAKTLKTKVHHSTGIVVCNY